MASFNPNSKSIATCIQELKDLNRKAKISRKTGDILTSRDPRVQKLAVDLEIKNIPDGFTKHRLPVFFEEATTTYMSFGAPGTDVEEHSHDEGDGLRVILFGSILYKDTELKQGDWMFLPAKSKYGFSVGPMGVGMFYCYSCCCA